MRKVRVDTRLKDRVKRGYQAIAESSEKDITEYEKQLLRLEKRQVEQARGITLTKEEIDDLRGIVNVKAVFPGSKIVDVSDKQTFKKGIRI